MDEFTLYVSPLGVLSLRTSKCRKYEILFRECKSADKVYSFLHVALHDHRPNGEAKHFYSMQDDAEAFRWIKALGDNAWTDGISLGSIVKGVQNSLSVKPKDRPVIEHEYVHLRLA